MSDKSVKMNSSKNYITIATGIIALALAGCSNNDDGSATKGAKGSGQRSETRTAVNGADNGGTGSTGRGVGSNTSAGNGVSTSTPPASGSDAPTGGPSSSNGGSGNTNEGTPSNVNSGTSSSTGAANK